MMLFPAWERLLFRPAALQDQDVRNKHSQDNHMIGTRHPAPLYWFNLNASIRAGGDVARAS
eukprot:2132313-Alexandrium_andersonii.AAC.1